MTLLQDATELGSHGLGNLVTIKQGAALKGVKYDALRVWLRNHPEIKIWRVGTTITMRKEDLEKYNCR